MPPESGLASSHQGVVRRLGCAGLVLAAVDPQDREYGDPSSPREHYNPGPEGARPRAPRRRHSQHAGEFLTRLAQGDRFHSPRISTDHHFKQAGFVPLRKL